MPLIEVIRRYDYAECDSPGCDKRLDLNRSITVGRAADQIMLLNGWTRWASRGTRVYCPAHGPKPGHKMRQVDLSRP